jgi:GMP synthase (glutamine-hydrolysing)
MLLVVDNGSSTLSELESVLQKLKVNNRIMRYDQPIKLSDYSGVILTGRSSPSDVINRANMRLIREATLHRKPLLGICYGAEILALAYGGSLSRLREKVYGYNTVFVKKANPLTEPQQKLQVFESHIFNIFRLPSSLEALAYSESCENEIIAHREFMLYGLQFHPECSGEDGLRMLQNFVKLLRERTDSIV